ncbi:hypothetical protein [Variovorax sp. LT1R16]|uniref:hypothetical protein n=1 Tax=Variovorax sp. LT1R16 TaxID=3443728 RepID=UPI003F46640D
MAATRARRALNEEEERGKAGTGNSFFMQFGEVFGNKVSPRVSTGRRQTAMVHIARPFLGNRAKPSACSYKKVAMDRARRIRRHAAFPYR